MSRTLLTSATLAVFTACGGSADVEFPEGLAALEDCTASLPEGDDHPEELVVVSGMDEVAWAHAAFYVHAPVEDVLTALEQPEVAVDYSRVDSWTYEVMDAPEFDYELILDNLSEDIVNVEFELTWKYGVVASDDDGVATAAGVRWGKTGGSDLIELLEGSATLEQVEEGVTSVQLVEWLDNPIPSDDDIVAYFEILFANLQAEVDGEPLPYPKDA